MEEKKVCDYGCGQEAHYQMKNGKWCCHQSYNKCLGMKKRNSEGVLKAYDEGRLDAIQIYYNKSDASKRRMNHNKGKFECKEEIFKKDSYHSTEYLKEMILFYDLLKYECGKCKIIEWQGEKIVLELDHINGDRQDNRIENLRFYCPNCHSQTPTFKGRNRNKGIKIISDEEFIEALKTSKTIRQALIKVKLDPKGANYIRAKRLLQIINGIRHPGGMADALASKASGKP